MRTTIILNDSDVEHLNKLVKAYPLAPVHRLTQAAIRRGLRQLAAAPTELLAETADAKEAPSRKPARRPAKRK